MKRLSKLIGSIQNWFNIGTSFQSAGLGRSEFGVDFGCFVSNNKYMTEGYRVVVSVGGVFIKWGFSVDFYFIKAPVNA